MDMGTATATATAPRTVLAMGEGRRHDPAPRTRRQTGRPDRGPRPERGGRPVKIGPRLPTPDRAFRSAPRRLRRGSELVRLVPELRFALRSRDASHALEHQLSA